MHKVAILVGTMTGTAELVAAEVEATLHAGAFDVTVELMDDLTSAVFTPDRLYLICTSTYGSGDVPDNAQALLADLETSRPDLTGIAFGLIALGDTTYRATFCHGGLRFASVLRELGATRLGEPLLHDAAAGTLPEDIASEWATRWIAEEVAHMADGVVV